METMLYAESDGQIAKVLVAQVSGGGGGEYPGLRPWAGE